MIPLLHSSEYSFVQNYIQTLDFTHRRTYAQWLAQTFHFVSHSVRLSALGASAIDVDHPLARRMVAHTREETGHHNLARNDIRALEMDVADFPPFGVTNAFFQAQYYKVLFEHPAHLLGQILMLEALAADRGSWLLDVVEPVFGKSASRFLELHSREDQEHVAKALAALEELPPDQQEGVKINFRQACELYYLILRSIREQSFAELVQLETRRPAGSTVM
jgi:hypothetical protein